MPWNPSVSYVRYISDFFIFSTKHLVRVERLTIRIAVYSWVLTRETKMRSTRSRLPLSYVTSTTADRHKYAIRFSFSYLTQNSKFVKSWTENVDWSGRTMPVGRNFSFARGPSYYVRFRCRFHFRSLPSSQGHSFLLLGVKGDPTVGRPEVRFIFTRWVFFFMTLPAL